MVCSAGVHPGFARLTRDHETADDPARDTVRMRYLLKQKFWSFGDDFTIQDQAGREAFFVDGAAFSWGDKLSFQGPRGRELARIHQKLLSWGPTYEIEVHGRLVAVVKKKLFTLFRCAFTVDV